MSKEATAGGGVRPRFMVWENVPGAFSSNRGADFGAVLQETIRVVEPEAPDVPVPDGGWPMAGCLFGANGGWSIAWRVLDAQFWGVPQRRRRISLVADFGGERAPEVLFEREGLSWDYPARRTPRERTAADATRSTDGAEQSGIRCMWRLLSWSGMFTVSTSRIKPLEGIWCVVYRFCVCMTQSPNAPA